MRHHHSDDSQTTEGLKTPETKEDLSSNNETKIWENYENTQATKPFNADDSDSSPAIVLPGLPGVHS